MKHLINVGDFSANKACPNYRVGGEMEKLDIDLPLATVFSA